MTTPKRRISPVTGIVLSVLLFATAAGVLFFLDYLRLRGSGPLLLGVVFVCTVMGGWRSGLLVTILSFLLLLWYFPPENSFRVADVEDWVRLVIFLGVSGLVIGLLVSRDRAFQSAKLAERRLATALSAARMGGWDRNLKTGAFWWSPGLEEIFGRRPDTFVPTYDEFLGYIHPDDRAFLTNAVTTSAESGTEFEIEHRIIRPDLGVRWIVTRGRIMFGTDGQAERIMGIAVDITERKAPNVIAHAGEASATAFPGRL